MKPKKPSIRLMLLPTMHQWKVPLIDAAIIICFTVIVMIVAGCGRAMLAPPPSVPNFPWPPPKPSAAWIKKISDLKPAVTNWGQCADLIGTELGDQRLGYFLVPDGFAIATSMVCVDESGLPNSGKDEAHACITPIKGLSMSAFRAAAARLFSSELGRCRVVVYIISDKPFATPTEGTPNDITGFINKGSNMLSNDLRTNTLTSSYALSVLIYEFSYSPADGNLTQVFPGETESRKQSIGIKLN